MLRKTILPGLFVTLAALGAWGEDESTSEAGRAVQVTLDVDAELLREDVQRHARMALERNRSLDRLSGLYRALDSALHRSDSASPETLEEVLRQIDAAERERSNQLEMERLLVERIRDRMHRIDLLEAKLTEIESAQQVRRGPLDGEWTVVMLPLEQRGVFTLRQSGALVNGTYRLEGNWSGSLQGTLVGRKLRLVRIDSRLGRSMEFEGFLSPDRNTIRGTWQSYDVSGGTAPSGHWSATRKRAEP